ncbi:uncharacterized protein LOC134658442 [Cydia amplana]|uniref:uncharacterized protein LOC134658442 n=1 Tax=Cydia amplana TaxID=1869771 RepID=UPI002FE54B3B
MSTLQSSNGGGISGTRELSGSQPNLAAGAEPDLQRPSFRNKRKLSDSSSDILTEMADLKKQMAEMMTLLKSSSKTLTENIEKLCQDVSTIKNQIGNISSSIDIMSAEQNQLKTDVKNLTTSVTAAENKVKVIETDLQSLRSSVARAPMALSPDSYNQLVAECQQRSIRDKNIIIVGIQEAGQDLAADREAFDKYEVEKITKTIYNDCPEPLQIIRLGKYVENKVRPIKATFASKATVKNILRNKNKTHDAKIYSDQTPYQRDFLKSVQEELQARTSNGETNLYIKYVKGIPKILSSQPKNYVQGTETETPPV